MEFSCTFRDLSISQKSCLVSAACQKCVKINIQTYNASMVNRAPSDVASLCSAQPAQLYVAALAKH